MTPNFPGFFFVFPTKFLLQSPGAAVMMMKRKVVVLVMMRDMMTGAWFMDGVMSVGRVTLCVTVTGGMTNTSAPLVGEF